MPTNKKTRLRVNWAFLAASTLCGLILAVFMCIPLVQATPCRTEDDTWCHWNAVTQGNGEGESFTTYWEGFTVR